MRFLLLLSLLVTGAVPFCVSPRAEYTTFCKLVSEVYFPNYPNVDDWRARDIAAKNESDLNKRFCSYDVFICLMTA